METDSETRRQATGSGDRPSRRKIVKGAIGAAAAGAAGGAALVKASPALAADQQGGLLATTVEQGGVAPAVVFLTDASTIAVDASLGDDYRVTISGSCVMGTPSNAANGQQIIFQITQGSAGGAVVTWDSGYEFSASLPQPALSTTAGQTDLLGFVYNAGKGTWLLAAFINGFS
jgi:hypothetical protein